MPQLAPLNWVILSVSLFVLLFGIYSSIWWMKKEPLVLSLRKGELLGGFVWCW